MSAAHDELLRLAEALPDDQVPAATALLRQLVSKSGRRTFRSEGIVSHRDLPQRASFSSPGSASN
ncbi:hypothetical protein D5S18_09585 [Nocardia panacis]|uniref:Uncharacterized protein n=1 Tax=Nocardia panacis TaxID=2340916 RepID=A0A3A4K665_9NOCA|nr:hypothetical protein [Nocardia panacis]RJO76539.1 hypothetical protein D5S18_09585 [Nocardia panacis]